MYLENKNIAFLGFPSGSIANTYAEFQNIRKSCHSWLYPSPRPVPDYQYIRKSCHSWLYPSPRPVPDCQNIRKSCHSWLYPSPRPVPDCQNITRKSTECLWTSEVKSMSAYRIIRANNPNVIIMDHNYICTGLYIPWNRMSIPGYIVNSLQVLRLQTHTDTLKYTYSWEDVGEISRVIITNL